MTYSLLLDRLRPLETHQPRELHTADMRHSAVLIPILSRDRDQFVFTLRAAHLKHHPGQISFPGGRLEPGEDPWDAAVREADEEIGIKPSQVRKLGRVDDVYSPRGFHVQCFAGLVESFDPVINHNEVERLIHVDLDELLNPDLHEVKPWKGYQVHYFNFREGMVWGVTGQIVHHLIQALQV